MKRLFALAAAVFLSAGTASPAQAAPLYSITNNTGLSLGNPPFTLGSAFTVNTAMQVTALGFFDDGQNGLVDSHQLGLWNSSGTLLASATISAGSVDPLNGQFRYVNIAPVNLTAGQTYTIGALYLSGADALIFPGMATGFATDPSASFVGSRFFSGAVLTNPTISGGDGNSNAAYFGPNAILAPVPEPATLAVFGLLAVSAYGLRRRLKAAA